MSDKPDGTGLTVDLMLRPEWAAVEKTDVDLTGIVPACVPGSQTIIIQHPVPAGKTLYVTSFGFAMMGQVGNIRAELLNFSTGVAQAQSGGAQGNYHSLSKPIRFLTGQVVRLNAAQYSAANAAIIGYIGGYEL